MKVKTLILIFLITLSANPAFTSRNDKNPERRLLTDILRSGRHANHPPSKSCGNEPEHLINEFKELEKNISETVEPILSDVLQMSHDFQNFFNLFLGKPLMPPLETKIKKSNHSNVEQKEETPVEEKETNDASSTIFKINVTLGNLGLDSLSTFFLYNSSGKEVPKNISETEVTTTILPDETTTTTTSTTTTTGSYADNQKEEKITTDSTTTLPDETTLNSTDEKVEDKKITRSNSTNENNRPQLDQKFVNAESSYSPETINFDLNNHLSDEINSNEINETLRNLTHIHDKLMNIKEDTIKHRRLLVLSILTQDHQEFLPKLVDYFYDLTQRIESLTNFTNDAINISKTSEVIQDAKSVNLTESPCQAAQKLPKDCKGAKEFYVKGSEEEFPNRQIPTRIRPSNFSQYFVERDYFYDYDEDDEKIYEKEDNKYLKELREKTDCTGVMVRCDQTTEGGGWTVVLHRQPQEDQLEFAKTWNEYITGFGDVENGGEYWIGLDTLHLLTKSHIYPHELLVEMSIGEEVAKSYYKDFSVGPLSDGFRLKVGGFDSKRSTGGDSLYYHDDQQFSTLDRDNDGASGGSCSSWSGGGGWWYDYCYFANPTGVFPPTNLRNNTESDTYIEWRKWQGYYTYLTSFTMKIRPKN